MWEISKCISKAVGDNKLKYAICLLSNIVIDKKFKDECLLLSRRLSTIDDQRIKNIESNENLSREENKIVDALNILRGKVKDDYSIVVDYISNVLNTDQDFSKANDIVRLNFSERLSLYSKRLSESIDHFQGEDLEYGEESNSLIRFIDLYEDSKDELLTKISNSENFTGHSIIEFIKTYLGPKSFQVEYLPVGIKSDIEVSSPYYADIILQNDSVKRHLLIWEENYIIGKYDEAYEAAEKARIGELSVRSINYEYSLLAYVNLKGFDKIISEAIRTKEKTKFDYTVLLMQRVIEQPDESTTRSDSVFYVYQQLSNSIKKIYNNIDYSYLMDGLDRGNSRRRNYIKNIIKTSIELLRKIPADFRGSIKFGLDILDELDGVGRYPWVRIANSSLMNRTNLDAIRLRKELIGLIVNDEYNIQNLYDRAIEKLNIIHKKKRETNGLNHEFLSKYKEEFQILNFLYSDYGNEIKEEIASIKNNENVTNLNSDGVVATDHSDVLSTNYLIRKIGDSIHTDKTEPGVNNFEDQNGVTLENNIQPKNEGAVNLKSPLVFNELESVDLRYIDKSVHSNPMGLEEINANLLSGIESNSFIIKRYYNLVLVLSGLIFLLTILLIVIFIKK